MNHPRIPATGTVMSLTALRVTELPRSVEFYIAGAGFERDREFSTDSFDAVILRAGNAGIELIRMRDGQGVVEHGTMLEKLVLNSADAAGLVERMIAHGGTELLAPSVIEKYQMVIGKVRDPDGYVIEVAGPVTVSGT